MVIRRNRIGLEYRVLIDTSIHRGLELDQSYPEGVSSLSPGLLYSATLGKRATWAAQPQRGCGWSLAVFGKDQIQIPRSTSSNSQVGKRDLSPLLALLQVSVNCKRRSGDKSLFPTCEFLMFGEPNQFLPQKVQLKMAEVKPQLKAARVSA